MSAVGRAARRRDLLAALCLVAGAALYLYAGARVRSLAASGVEPPPGRTRVQELDRRMAPLTAISRTGLALVAIGIGVGIWSFARHRASTPPTR